MNNKDLLGQAIFDYHGDNFEPPFNIHYRNHDLDEMPIEVFFREQENMPAIEQYALSLVKGRVLDIGAGAGCHSIALQEHGFDVTSVDYSEDCCKVMDELGVKRTICSDVFELDPTFKYDTIILLMNGIGLARTLENLVPTIHFLTSFLRKGGQLLFDSSDVAYLFEHTPKPTYYYGEIESKFEYRGMEGEWGKWLYVDPYTLINECEKDGINIEIIIEDDTGLYLARVNK